MTFVFITFIELVLEGGWNEVPEGDLRSQLDSIRRGTAFRANGPSEIKIVEPEVVIRRFMFGTNDVVYVGDSVISFDSVHIKEELSVDDKGRAVGGKRLKMSD